MWSSFWSFYATSDQQGLPTDLCLYQASFSNNTVTIPHSMGGLSLHLDCWLGLEAPSRNSVETVLLLLAFPSFHKLKTPHGIGPSVLKLCHSLPYTSSLDTRVCSTIYLSTHGNIKHALFCLFGSSFCTVNFHFRRSFMPKV